jgi:hypothetical protein
MRGFSWTAGGGALYLQLEHLPSNDDFAVACGRAALNVRYVGRARFDVRRPAATAPASAGTGGLNRARAFAAAAVVTASAAATATVGELSIAAAWAAGTEHPWATGESVIAGATSATACAAGRVRAALAAAADRAARTAAATMADTGAASSAAAGAIIGYFRDSPTAAAASDDRAVR